MTKTVIRVWREYTGNRCNWVIPIGEYDPGDESLYGLESYLVDNGNAISFEVEEVESIEPMQEIIEAIKTEEEVTIEPPKPKRGRRGKANA